MTRHRPLVGPPDPAGTPTRSRGPPLVRPRAASRVRSGGVAVETMGLEPTTPCLQSSPGGARSCRSERESPGHRPETVPEGTGPYPPVTARSRSFRGVTAGIKPMVSAEWATRCGGEADWRVHWSRRRNGPGRRSARMSSGMSGDPHGHHRGLARATLPLPHVGHPARRAPRTTRRGDSQKNPLPPHSTQSYGCRPTHAGQGSL